MRYLDANIRGQEEYQTMTNRSEPLLIPAPRRLNRAGGTLDLTTGGTIHLTAERPANLLFTAEQLQGHLEEASGQAWRIRAGVEEATVRLIVDATIAGGDEAYNLTITPQRIDIIGGSAAGLISAMTAKLAVPYGIAFDAVGNLYVSERYGHVIRMFKKWW